MGGGRVGRHEGIEPGLREEGGEGRRPLVRGRWGRGGRGGAGGGGGSAGAGADGGWSGGGGGDALAGGAHRERGGGEVHVEGVGSLERA